MWIDSRRFQHAAKHLAPAPSFTQIADLAAQIVVRVEEEEW
jgi:hypothetical protein